MAPIIETRDLTKFYPRVRSYRELLRHPFRKSHVRALESVNLQVERGELFVLLGPNGAGKTTLIKILSTLILPTSGQALIDGLDVLVHEKDVRRRIGYVVADERSFYWRLTGRANLAFFATLNNLDPAGAERRISEVIELVGLEEEAAKMFKDYSTGMRQKLAIARGLLTDPMVLFMDEPTRSLDPAAAKRVRDFIQGRIVRELGKTVFLSTHNLEEAEALCDRIAILHRGRIATCGTIDEIRRTITPAKRYWIGCGDVPEEAVGRIRSLPFVTSVTAGNGIASVPTPGEILPGGIEVETEPDGKGIETVIRILVESGVPVLSCFPREIPLLELFTRSLSTDHAAGSVSPDPGGR